MKAGHTQWAILWCLLVVPLHHLQRKDSLKSTDQSTSCRAVRKMLFCPPKQSAIQRLLPGRFNKKHKNESQILKSYKAINTIECFHILLCATFFAILLHYFLVCYFCSMVESMFAFQENNVFVVEVFQCSYVWFFFYAYVMWSNTDNQRVCVPALYRFNDSEALWFLLHVCQQMFIFLGGGICG